MDSVHYCYIWFGSQIHKDRLYQYNKYSAWILEMSQNFTFYNMDAVG